MADPLQARAKEKRLAEALRANLRRRKEQAREREEIPGPSACAQTDPAAVSDDASTGRK